MGIGRKIIIVICLIVFLFSAGMLGKYFYDSWKAQNDMNKLKQEQTQREDLVTDKGIVIGKYADLYLRNNDLIGWIKIPDTKLDYPVMSTPQEPEFYLRRNFDKDWSMPGTPFLDGNSDVFTPTANFLVYGHNIKSGTMFHTLEKYKDVEFYKGHKTFNFDTIYKGGQGEYEIVAFLDTLIVDNPARFSYYKFSGITTEQEYEEYVNGIKAESVYDTGITPEYGEQLVTLSTCTNKDDNGRYVLVGRRIK